MKKLADSQLNCPLIAVLCALCLISCVTLKCATPYITAPGAAGFWKKQFGGTTL